MQTASRSPLLSNLLCCVLLVAGSFTAQSQIPGMALRPDGVALPNINRNQVQNPSPGLIIYDGRLSLRNTTEWEEISGSPFEKFGNLIRQKSGSNEDDFIVGRRELPDDNFLEDRFFFFDRSKGAFRGGQLDESNAWSPDSIGPSSFAYGRNPKASAPNSVAFGEDVIASGNGSIAVGIGSIASGSFGAIALGRSNHASGISGATALGNGTIASGNGGATALGAGTIAAGNSCISLGRYNDSIVSPGTTLGDESPIFIIGNGSSDSDRSNALVTQYNGHSTFYRNSTGTIPQVTLHEEEEDFARLNFSNTSGNEYWTIARRTWSNGNKGSARLNFFYSDETGNVLRLFGDGNATLTGTLTESSDINLKKDITSLEPVLENILKISGYRYKWKNNINSDPQIGLIAQEVQTFYPELVLEDEEGTLSVSYTKMVPILLEAIKEQQQQIDYLQDELSFIKSSIKK